MITKLALALALASTTVAPFADTAEAAAGQFPVGIGGAPSGLLPIEEAQFAFGGRNFCWYGDGWSGPGWYWCGYASRRGVGYGGGDGWQGWRRGGGGRHYGGGGYGGRGRYEGDGRGAGVGGNPGPGMSHGKGAGGAPVYTK